MTKTALIIVDYSVDFIADDGKLTCGVPGQKLENFLVNRINQFNENRDDIFFMMDLHYENDDFHPESKLFPPHNIEGSVGRQLYGEVGKLYESIKTQNNVHF